MASMPSLPLSTIRACNRGAQDRLQGDFISWFGLEDIGHRSQDPFPMVLILLLPEEDAT